MAVDPKRDTGGPAYDGGTLLKSRALKLLEADDLSRAAYRILATFTETADVDHEPARRWAQFHSVQAETSSRYHGFRITRSEPRLDRLAEFTDQPAELLLGPAWTANGP